VRSVNKDLLKRRLRDGDIVSLTQLGASPSGEVFFVSSEELAAAAARKLQAMKLVYITQGEHLVDSRDGRVIAGLQAHNARDLLLHLEGSGADAYAEEEKSSDWFKGFVRHLRLIINSVSSIGVRRGHLVNPTPGALLQEFYTTDGSGTVIAQDSYQGLGCATVGDSLRIRELLEDDASRRGVTSELYEPVDVEGGCASKEFFVWRRDEEVLGCGQLVAHKFTTSDAKGPEQTLAAELRCFAVAEGTFVTHALALLAYAERAAFRGGATLLTTLPDQDPRRTKWLKGLGFRDALPAEIATHPPNSAGLLVKPLGASTEQEVEQYIAAFAEEQRMWGGLN